MHALSRILATAIVATAIVGCGGGGGDDDGPPLPKGEPFPPEMTARLHEIRDRMAEIRGQQINPGLSERLLDEQVLSDWFRDPEGAPTDEERAEIEAFNVAFRLMRLIGPDDDLYDEFTELNAEGIAGFYEDESNALVLVDNEVNISRDDEITLAHEYVHSFQYAAFDVETLNELSEGEEEGDSTEYNVTTSCVKEGDATLSMFLYGDQAFEPGWQDTLDEESGEPEEALPDDVPEALQRYDYFDYAECYRFARALYDEAGGSFERINALYDDPPSTTEQIMHPDKYGDREDVTGMDAIDLTPRLGDGWTQRLQDLYGEFDLFNYILSVTGDYGMATDAAAGWGVGWISLYEQDDDTDDDGDREVVLHIGLEFDSREEMEEFAIAYGILLDTLPDTEIKYIPGAPPVCWEAPDEYGYFTFAESQPRADIVIATTKEARRAVTFNASLSSLTTGTCPVD